jgi:hypothetical protein
MRVCGLDAAATVRFSFGEARYRNDALGSAGASASSRVAIERQAFTKADHGPLAECVSDRNGMGWCCAHERQ